MICSIISLSSFHQRWRFHPVVRVIGVIQSSWKAVLGGSNSASLDITLQGLDLKVLPAVIHTHYRDPVADADQA
jgi:hypothetical protein